MGKIRRLSEVGIYHIYLRGNSKFIIFYEDDDYRQFCKCIDIARVKHRAKIYAYALMDNHIHLLVRCVAIDKFVSGFMIGFVMWYNRKYKLSDRLCQSPYNSAVKNTYAKIRSSILYILQNPVKARMCSTHEEHKWSSYKMYFNNIDKKKKRIADVFTNIEVDTSMVQEMFESKENLDFELSNNPVSEKEIREKEDNWKRISHSELCAEFSNLLKKRVLSDLSREELKMIARLLIRNTTASYGQIASLLHVSYEFVRKLKYR
ncbi:MAG: transposase [Bacteroidales bacterium]